MHQHSFRNNSVGILQAAGLDVKELLFCLVSDKNDLLDGQIDLILEASTLLDTNLQERLLATDDYFELLNRRSGSQYPIDKVDNWWGDANFRSSGAVAVSMTPEKYLSSVKSLEIDEETLENVSDLVRHIQSGGRLDPAVIYEGGKEDGRHRALAAKQLGYTAIPVIDYRGAEKNIQKAIHNTIRLRKRNHPEKRQRGLRRQIKSPSSVDMNLI